MERDFASGPPDPGCYLLQVVQCKQLSGLSAVALGSALTFCLMHERIACRPKSLRALLFHPDPVDFLSTWHRLLSLFL